MSVQIDQTHTVEIVPGTLLHRIVRAPTMQVNSAHHQAVRGTGRFAVVNATAPDGVIEGIEDARYGFALGVQWHPEYFAETDATSRAIFQAFGEACRAYRAAG